MRTFRVLTPALSSLLAVACGGGGGGSGGPQSLTLSSMPSIDGTVTRTAASGFKIANATGTFVGTFYGGGASLIEERMLVSFDLAALPSGANVVSATLHMELASVSGTPFGFGSRLVVDDVDLGTALDPTDWDALAFRIGVGNLAVSSTLGPRALDVATDVREALAAGRRYAQFRLELTPLPPATDTEGAYLTTSNAGGGVPPSLVVQYTKP